MVLEYSPGAHPVVRIGIAGEGATFDKLYEEYPLFLVDGHTEPPRASLLLFEYGKSKAGYFTTEHFVRNQFAALMLFEFLFPENRLFAVYDNATIHRSRGNDSLDASVMNLSPGGRQRKQRDTMYTDKTGVSVVQRLVTDSNVAKGLLQILSERGETWVKKPSKPQAVAMLNKYDDSRTSPRGSSASSTFRHAGIGCCLRRSATPSCSTRSSRAGPR